MPRRYPMPQDYAPATEWGGGAMQGIGAFVTNFMQAYEMAQQRKREEAGMILQLLSEYGGELTPEQMGGLEKTLGRNPQVRGLIRSAFQPTYETQPAFAETEEGEPSVVEQISTGKLKGYRMPSRGERETAKKQKELEIEQPYKKELKEMEIASKEELEGIRATHRKELAELHTKILSDKITAMQENVRLKIESAERIAADANATREQISAANNETKMAVNNLAQQVELLKTLMVTQSREKIEGKKAEVKEKEIAGKSEEDKKAMSEIEKRKSFNDDVKKGGFLESNGQWKVLTREDADRLKQIAESYGYTYDEKETSTYWGMGAGGFTPVIDFKPRKTKEQKGAEEEGGEKPKKKKFKRINVDQLRKEAKEAIAKGADPLAVKKRFKEMTGESLF